MNEEEGKGGWIEDFYNSALVSISALLSSLLSSAPESDANEEGNENEIVAG